MRRVTSFIAITSVIVSLLMVSSLFFTGPALGQQYDAGNGGSYSGENYSPPVQETGDLAIPGLEALQGFVPGENVMSLAVIPVSQQGNQQYFQLIGFAISNPSGGQSVVYSLRTPLSGAIDPATNTMQVDLSDLAVAISQAGYISSSDIYNTLRTDSRVLIIDVDMTYQGIQGSQTTFSVNTVDIVPPDGRMQSFSLQQPTQLIIDADTMRISMVAFPQMINAISTFSGAGYPDVQPVVFSQPVPIMSPVFVPYVQPFPIFIQSYVPFTPFFFGAGFRPFFHERFHDLFPIHDRFFGRGEFNEFNRFRGGDRNVFGRSEFSRDRPRNEIQPVDDMFRRGSGWEDRNPGRTPGAFSRDGGKAGLTGGTRERTGVRPNTPAQRGPGSISGPGSAGGNRQFAPGGNIQAPSGRGPNTVAGMTPGRTGIGSGSPGRTPGGMSGGGTSRIGSGGAGRIGTQSFTGGASRGAPARNAQSSRASAPSGSSSSGGGGGRRR